MGYYMEQVEANFRINAENKAAALAAIQSLGSPEADGDIPSFTWVDTNRFMEAETLAEAFDAWRWDVEEDVDGNVVEISFQGQKLGCDDVFFKAISPFVLSGSYIEMSGEDSAHWRWTFDHGNFEEKHATVTWD
jgi:hypothetical protein